VPVQAKLSLRSPNSATMVPTLGEGVVESAVGDRLSYGTQQRNARTAIHFMSVIFFASDRNVTAATSKAIVMPRARRGRSCDAGDRTEIFVDGPQVMVRQVPKTRPRHCLEKVSIEWSGNAARVNNRTGGPVAQVGWR